MTGNNEPRKGVPATGVGKTAIYCFAGLVPTSSYQYVVKTINWFSRFFFEEMLILEDNL